MGHNSPEVCAEPTMLEHQISELRQANANLANQLDRLTKLNEKLHPEPATKEGSNAEPKKANYGLASDMTDQITILHSLSYSIEIQIAKLEKQI